MIKIANAMRSVIGYKWFDDCVAAYLPLGRILPCSRISAHGQLYYMSGVKGRSSYLNKHQSMFNLVTGNLEMCN